MVSGVTLWLSLHSNLNAKVYANTIHSFRVDLDGEVLRLEEIKPYKGILKIFCEILTKKKQEVQ